MDNRIFNEQYGSGKAKSEKLPFFYRILKKYEIHRTDAVGVLVKEDNLSVLEVGCSNGYFLKQNSAKWKSIVGVDIVDKLIKIAASKDYGAPARFYKTDFGRIKTSMKTNSFDLVVTIATLQLIYDLDLFFQNIRKVLKKDGQFIIEVPNIAVFWRRVQLLFGIFPKTSCFSNGWDGGTIHYFTQKNLTEYLLKYDFRVERVVCSGIGAKIRSLWPSLLGADLIFVCRKK